MDAKELDELLEEPFNVPDLAQLWPEILRYHTDMGFRMPITNMETGTPLTDNQMIEEYQWIYSQYKKYIGTHRVPWLSMRDNLEALLANIKEAIQKDSKTPENRKELVYQMMRNQWLTDTWNHFAWIIEQLTEEEDDGE